MPRGKIELTKYDLIQMRLILRGKMLEWMFIHGQGHPSVVNLENLVNKLEPLNLGTDGTFTLERNSDVDPV